MTSVPSSDWRSFGCATEWYKAVPLPDEQDYEGSGSTSCERALERTYSRKPDELLQEVQIENPYVFMSRKAVFGFGNVTVAAYQQLLACAMASKNPQQFHECERIVKPVYSSHREYKKAISPCFPDIRKLCGEFVRGAVHLEQYECADFWLSRAQTCIQPLQAPYVRHFDSYGYEKDRF